MSSRAEPEKRPTTLVPVTSMEEIPILSVEERMSLAASIVEAEARIKKGEFVEFEPAAFKERLLQSFVAAKRARKE